MTDSVAHRGPDASGHYLEGPVALGHQRLAVIDLSGGAQPMIARDESGRDTAALVFAGEIYNYKKLRQELVDNGVRFLTNSDTEVVLRAYLAWGESAFVKFAGMFAIVLWDAARQRMVMARDRSGIKPLYYQDIRNGVVFGSEPKALLAHDLIEPIADMASIANTIDMTKVPGTTPYRDMWELKAGTTRVYTRAGVKEDRYWRLATAVHGETYADTVEKGREIFDSVLAEQAHADVPVGSLLSGGLDSSLITAAAARLPIAEALASFSLEFTSTEEFSKDFVRGSEDAPYARDLATWAGTIHHEVIVASDAMLEPEVRDSVSRAVDGPTAFWGDMWPSLYILFQEVKQHVTVALSGEGADEVFGGYHWFHNPAARSFEGFPWLTPGSSRYFGGAALWNDTFKKDLATDERRRTSYLEAVAEIDFLPEEGPAERQFRTISYLSITRFMQTLLDRKDRMSMASGLEVRVPYCDHRLIEYVYNVPWVMKAEGGRVKGLLQDIAGERIPNSIRVRKKSPYPVTQESSYERGLRSQVKTILEDKQSPVRDFLDLPKAAVAAGREVTGNSMAHHRGSLELTIALNTWMRDYDVQIW